MINEISGLTETEDKISDLLIEAFSLFSQLERQHPDEPRLFTDGIRICQTVLGMRIVRRDYPEHWPIK